MEMDWDEAHVSVIEMSGDPACIVSVMQLLTRELTGA